jgi:hypothetical protein
MMDSDDNDLGQRLADAGDEYVNDLVARLKPAVTVDDVRRVLCEGRDYYRDVILAFPVLIKTNEEACKAILRLLLNDCMNLRFALKARSVVTRLPREWVLSHVEEAARDWLAPDDQDGHLLTLELYDRLSPVLASRLANRLLTNPDEAMQEIGKDYLDASRGGEGEGLGST